MNAKQGTGIDGPAVADIMSNPIRVKILQGIADLSREYNGVYLENIDESIGLPSDRTYYHLSVLTHLGVIRTELRNGTMDGNPHVLYHLTDLGSRIVKDIMIVPSKNEGAS